MAGLKTALMMALGISAAALLSGCDNGPSAVASGKQAAGTQMASAEPPGGGRYARSYDNGDDATQVDHRKDPVAMAHGKPVWAASRRYSADESAQHAFERNGDAFGARSLDQYVEKVHAFVDHPPQGVQTITRRNGDVLYYDAKANIFAVATKDGAPRTMFRPDDGAAYWQQQKDRAAKQATYASRKSHSGDDDAAE